MKAIIGCFISAVLGGLCAVWVMDASSADRAAAQEGGTRRGPAFPQKKAPGSPADAKQPAVAVNTNGIDLSPEEAVNVAVYQKTNKSVVNISTRGAERLFQFDGGDEGSGSGCVLDKKGHILTNYHVIENARHAGVTLFDGKTYEATLVGADPINDIAIIRINAPKEKLFPVTLGDSSRLRVGMRVFAIGNPFGLERSMTTGIISSLNRSLKIRSNRTIHSIIQIDAAVNPGNSGGPLLDRRGHLIGINTAIASRTGQNSGVGFAIPSNLIGRVVPQLLKHGRVIRPEIGIRRVYETDDGLLIASLSPGGPAARAGLRGPRVTRTRRGIFIIERVDRAAADLIVAIDGKPVKTADAFLGRIESKRPGDAITLTILREGRKMDVKVILSGGKRPPIR
ncbi:MAG: trypsin-like peptidase domain-containing protein [Planctomycetes bacterium]|nr:trypsin-like peptidase domain-containing protein [Planctomycetota bacterium]